METITVDQQTSTQQMKSSPISQDDHITSDSNPSTKLTDVNVDCMEMVYHNLPFSDLLHMADSKKYLKSVAETIFGRKYAKNQMQIEMIPDASHPTCNVQRNWTRVNDMKSCLQTLRCFGHLMSNIHITGDQFDPYGRKTNRVSHLIQYLDKYCSEHIKEITFEKFSSNAFSYVNASYPMVETVRFKYCSLQNNFKRINKLFPNAKSLELLWSDVNNINSHFPNVERIEINIPISLSPSQMTSIKEMILSNPQLKGLKLYIGWNVEFIRELSEFMRTVEDLEISCVFSDHVEFDRSPIHFVGVKKFSILGYGAAAGPNVEITFDELQHFKLVTMNLRPMEAA